MLEQNLCETRQKGFYIKKLGSKESLTRTRGIRKSAKDCAREARERKKIYTSKIERQLEETKCSLQRALEENHNLQCALQAKNKHVSHSSVTNEGFQGLMQEFQRLYANLHKNDGHQIARSLSFLRDKYGISGRERFKNIDSIFNRLVGVIMPMHYRLLMENATKNKEFYELLGPRTSQKGLVKFSEFQRSVILGVRPKINKQKKEYDQILQQLAEISHRIKKQNIQCQGIVDEIQDKLSPIYVAKLLVDLDCSRSKSGLDEAYPLNFWSQVKAGPMASVSVSQNHNQNVIQDNRNDVMVNYEFDQEIFNSLFI